MEEIIGHTVSSLQRGPGIEPATNGGMERCQDLFDSLKLMVSGIEALVKFLDDHQRRAGPATYNVSNSATCSTIAKLDRSVVSKTNLNLPPLAHAYLAHRDTPGPFAGPR
jgi:hypothetical protein